MTADGASIGDASDSADGNDASRGELSRVVRDVRTLTASFETSTFPSNRRGGGQFTGVLGLEPWHPSWPQPALSFLRSAPRILEAVVGSPESPQTDGADDGGEVLSHSVVSTDRPTAHDDGGGTTGNHGAGTEQAGADDDDEPARVRDLIRAKPVGTSGATDEPSVSGPSATSGRRDDRAADHGRTERRSDHVDGPTLRSATSSAVPSVSPADPSTRAGERHRTGMHRDRSGHSRGDGRSDGADLTGPADTPDVAGTDVRSPPSATSSFGDDRSPRVEAAVTGRVDRSKVPERDPPPMTPLRVGHRSAPSGPSREASAAGRARTSPPMGGTHEGGTHGIDAFGDAASGGRSAGGDGSVGSTTRPDSPSASEWGGRTLAERVDVDRLADRLTDVFERNARVERERRGR